MISLKVLKYGTMYKVVEYRTTKGGHGREETVNDERLENNISRAKSRIYELASCNEWEYFVTLTLSPRFDRDDLEMWRKRFTQWLRDLRKIGYDVRYVLVPEPHENGAWHFHGFMSGLDDVRPFRASDIGCGDTSPQVAAYKAAELNKAGLLCWSRYNVKWGFATLSKVKNPEACARYCTKYVTKSLQSSVLSSGAHLFYASRGLSGAQTIACNAMELELGSFGALSSQQYSRFFRNEFVREWWFDNPQNIPPLVDYITGEEFEFTKSE